MSIYSRDNVNYSGMIQNMLQSARHGGEIRANNLRKQGEIWGGAIKDAGSVIGRAYGMYGGSGGMSDAEIELKELEKEREELLAQEQAEQQRMMEDYSKDIGMVGNEAYMQGYRPNVVAGNLGAYENPYAIPGNPYATQEEYFKYIQAMNGIYGGK